jgi:phytoene dehydrogenase-like protein
MRNYFRPFVSSFELRGGCYGPNQLITQIATHPEGFLITSRNARSGNISQYLATHSLILNLTVWDMLSDIIPKNDPLRATRVYKKWKKRCDNERGWGAFAIYALVTDNPLWTDAPQYHQVFPDSIEPDLIQSSLYVSIPSRDDPANPTGFRVLTATIHIDSNQQFSSELKTQTTQLLVKRIERALNSTLSNVESATPSTYARYTQRQHGQVGGFQLSFKNFLFLALPSMVKHPLGKDTRLLLCGDTFFPGQGVIACSVSGIIAFERACKVNFYRLIKQGKVIR